MLFLVRLYPQVPNLSNQRWRFSGAVTPVTFKIRSSGIFGTLVGARVVADLAKAVGNCATDQQQNGIITVEQASSSGLLGNSENGRVGCAVGKDKVLSWCNRSFQVEGLPRCSAAVEEDLKLPGSQIYRCVADIEQLDGLVVARAFNVFTDDQ